MKISLSLLSLGLMGLLSFSIAAEKSAAGRIAIAGEVSDAATGSPLRGVYLTAKGAALAASANSELKRRSNDTGKYEMSLPPGDYVLAAEIDGYQRQNKTITVVAGGAATYHFKLEKTPESGPYRVETIELPMQMGPDVSGVTFTPAGDLVAVNRHGEVWIRKTADGSWRRFASGLFECFGVVAISDREIYVTQKPEVTRLLDADGDGRAEIFECVTSVWGTTGNYHEFPFGLVRDRFGNFYGATGMTSAEAGKFKNLITRGPLQIKYLGPGKEPTEPQRSAVRYQGWAYQVTPAGDFIPYASGLREPAGIGLSPRDELFVTDVAGSWVPTSVLMHVQKDNFYGHPDGLKWDPDFAGKPITIEQMRELRVPPVVYIPHGVLGTSAGQPVWDTTNGKFGPFGGQIFMGDVSGPVMRVDLEKVAGRYQGAVFPFLAGRLRSGSMRTVFSPTGELYFGQSVRGWMPTGGEGIQRIKWTGENPVAIKTMRLTDRGFALTFTEPMQAESLADRATYQIRRFQYDYSVSDGSRQMNEADVPVAAANARADGTGVTLDLAELQPGYIYELEIKGLGSRSGAPLENGSAYYTANHLLAGHDATAPSKLLTKTDAATGPGDPAKGKLLYQQLCMACHLPDGRGSPQIGSADFTSPQGPLAGPDAKMIVQIKNGGKVMPALGGQLSDRDIRNIIAYVRQAFGTNVPQPPPTQ